MSGETNRTLHTCIGARLQSRSGTYCKSNHCGGGSGKLLRRHHRLLLSSEQGRVGAGTNGGGGGKKPRTRWFGEEVAHASPLSSGLSTEVK